MNNNLISVPREWLERLSEICDRIIDEDYNSMYTLGEIVGCASRAKDILKLNPKSDEKGA